jgi:Carboxypeptidase regulatory-like domain/TonB dependent receptor-like, beta-barrel/TonB-dependent Receptor Plug Domain
VRKPWVIVSASLLALSLAGVGFAQISTGGIRGIVRDETGAILVGVTVAAESPARIGGAAVEVTNSQGLYRFQGLSIGVYTVTFEIQGFATLKRENVRVEVDRSVQLDVTMSLATAAETVTVTAESPVIDTLRAGYSTRFNQELVENVPTTRASYFDLITYAPGVRTNQEANVSNFSVYGSNTDQNSFQYNGVDVSAPSYGSPWDFPNFDIIQEVEVLAVGASAEYTGFQGGVVNIITKSGSNTWTGTSSFFLQDSALTGNNTPDEQYPYYIDYQHQFTQQIGGPIKRDKLWVFGAIELTRNRNSQVGVDPTFAPKRHVWRPYVKLNSQLSSSNNLEFMFNDNNFYSPNAASRTQPTQTINIENGHNPTISARWTHTFSPSTVLEVKGGGIYIRDREDPYSGDYNTPGRYDFSTGSYSVNSFYTWKSEQNKTQVAAAVTHYADNFAGSHDFKFGVQMERSDSLTAQAYFNNSYYFDYNGPYYVLTREPFNRKAQMDTSAGFVNDNWTVSDRMTLNLGLRFDHTSGSIPEVQQLDNSLNNSTGVTFPAKSGLITFNTVSPRVGVTFTLDKGAKTVAKASYGRYYGKLVGNMFANASPGNTSLAAYLFDATTDAYDIPFYTVNPNRQFAIDPDLKNQYTDQFFVGLEREIMPDLGVDLSFIHKKEHGFIRVDDVAGDYAEVPFVDTFQGNTQTLQVFNRTSPSAQSLYQVTNRDDFRQNYDSFAIQAYKRFSQRWQLQGSYQWQKGEGYTSGSTGIGSQAFSTLSPSSFGRDPNDLINAYGRLPTDSTNNMRLSATYSAPKGFHIGARYSYESGRPYARVINVTGLKQGVRRVQAETRGSYALPAVNEFQVRVDKDFMFGTGPQRLRLSIDIYNLFNADTFTDVRNNSSDTGDANFGQALAILPPRRAMVGIRFEF